MKETNCDVIRDLLPLYEDNVVSEETAEMVREHLADCPACREELRKMRTPISLPPSEDEEAVKRFLEHRAEVRKKQNVKIACVVSLLAAVIVFCLCYTLIPRSWDSVAHGMEIDWVMGNHSLFVIQPGEIHSEVWQISGEEDTNDVVTNAFMNALQSGSYRAELRNVMNHTPLAFLVQDRSIEGSMGMVNLYLVQDNEVVVTAAFYDDYRHTVHVWTAENDNTFFYHTDGAVCDALAALMKEHGIKK